MFYRLKVKEGAELINLALVRAIKQEGNRLTFLYQTHPESFARPTWQETRFYTYDKPRHAEETFAAIEKALEAASQLK
jgi:hypothetical protein